MLTLIPLLRAAILSAKPRLELLFLLTALAGLLTTLVYSSSLTAIVELIENSQDEMDITVLSEQIAEHLPTLILGQVGLMAIVGFLLPLWARAASPVPCFPWDGSVANFLRRGILGFLHQTTAAILTLVGVTFTIMVAAVLGAVGGPIGGFAMILAVFFAIWISIFFSAAAHTAIIGAATDQKISYSDAITKNRAVLRPILGSLAAIWFFSLAVDVLIESLLTSLFDTVPPYQVLAFLKGGFGFLVAALHINVLFIIPGIFSANTQK